MRIISIFLRPISCSALLLVAGSTMFCQPATDGFIVSRQAVTLPETTIGSLETRVPDIRQTLANVRLESITYMSGGLRVKGYLAVPVGRGQHPCVIYNRGGNREFGAWTDTRAARILMKIASWGYVVVASQYRGNGGGEGTEEFGGSDVDDVLNLVPLLAGEPAADTSRVGMYGWSRGGMMTYLALKRSCRFRAAVVGSGLADLFESRASRPEMETEVFFQLIPGYDLARDSLLTSRSARYWPGQICKTTPLLVMQGSADWRVSPAPVLDLVGGLYRSNHPVRFVFLEGGQHSLIEHSAEVDRLARDFLDLYVRDGKRWPDLAPHGD
jgi:dipeptidyl aminopeptidase/acylaminoacyl peptidase